MKWKKPHKTLVAIGDLRQIDYRNFDGRIVKKTFNSSAMLCVDPVTKRLHIVTKKNLKGRVKPDKIGLDFYDDIRWGLSPKSSGAYAYDMPTALQEIGEVVNVTYRGLKGRDPMTDYYHPFEDELPVLAEDTTTKKLYFVGGSYTVKTHGIIG